MKSPVTSILSAEQLQNLFDGTTDLLQGVAPDGSFLFVNKSWCEVLGYPLDEILALNVFDVIDPEYHDHYRNFMQRIISGEDVGLIKTVFKSKSNQVVNLEGYVNLRVENGQPIAMCGTFRRATKRKMEDEFRHIDENPECLISKRTNTHVTNLKQKETSLVESYQLFQMIIDTIPIRIFWKDKQLRYLGSNLAFAEDAGVETLQDLVGKNDYQLGWKELAESYRRDDLDVIKSGCAMLAYEEPQITPDGRRVYLRTSKVPLRTDEGEIIGVLGVYQDITDEKKAHDAMQLANTIYQLSNEAIVLTDDNNLILKINPAFTRLTGYEEQDVIGKNPGIFQSGRHSDVFYREMWHDLLKNDQWQGEIRDRHKDGSVYAAWVTINLIRHVDGYINYHVARFSDITEKNQKDDLLVKQANYDQLTQLPNRNLFKERLEQEIKRSQRSGLPLSVLFLDLDHFKDINDTYGHDKGDELLIEVADRINGCVRKTDTVARLGGDEFTVILPEIVDEVRISDIAQKINQVLNKPFRFSQDEIDYHISSSIGVVIYPRDGEDIKSIMKHADQAMYAAKEERNCYSYFTPGMQQATNQRMVLISDLRQALVRNELEVYYQPILDLSHKRIIKAEALLRWRHTQYGTINPATFIPLAEESGLIVEIGNWVMAQIIHLIEIWRKRFGEIIQISVNMSPIQFKQKTELALSGKILEMRLPGNSINMEITEGLLLKASAIVKDRLLEFQDSGVEVSIDDFATGFSSLSYLKKFNINYLKIDRSFVNNLNEDAPDLALVEAIIVMAHKLNIKTIAEGVETKEQEDLLTEIGCDYVQGYFYSPPVPVDQFEQLLVEQMD